jgi:hypothetical protein
MPSGLVSVATPHVDLCNEVESSEMSFARLAHPEAVLESSASGLLARFAVLAFRENLMGLVSWAFGFGVFRFGWKTGG